MNNSRRNEERDWNRMVEPTRSPSPIESAADRLARAIDRLEIVLAERAGRASAERPEELAALADALRAAELERTVLSDASRTAAAQLDLTIGRLRGLLTP